MAVKESVFPFIKFPGVDSILGPEMKSTGEVMGLDRTFGKSFYKAVLAAGYKLPEEGKAFISVIDEDKEMAVDVAKKLVSAGLGIIATSGTADYLSAQGVEVEEVFKVGEGKPDCVDLISEGVIALVINTTFGKKSIDDSYTIRRTALTMNVPYQTTIEGAMATAIAIEEREDKGITVLSLQEYFD